jgi:hypothetical protein
VAAAPAPRHAGQDWTLTELLAATGALAATPAGRAAPFAVSGSRLDLARQACACSRENRPFRAVDRNRPVRWAGRPPAGVALVIAAGGSAGEPRAGCRASPAAMLRVPFFPSAFVQSSAG